MDVEIDENFTFEELDVKPKIRRVSFCIDIEVDFRYWNILPVVALNFHSKTLEIQWLCFGLYIEKNRNNGS